LTSFEKQGIYQPALPLLLIRIKAIAAQSTAMLSAKNLVLVAVTVRKLNLKTLQSQMFKRFLISSKLD
jgi:hypothetical protein